METTVRRQPVSRRTLLSGTAGMLGGAALSNRGTRPEHRASEHRRGAQITLQSALPHRGLAGAAAGGDHRAGTGDRRSAPSPVGSPGEPFSP
jgi:hypothetical protein